MGFFNFYRNYVDVQRLEQTCANMCELLDDERRKYQKEISHLEEKLNEPAPSIFSKRQQIGDLKIKRVMVRTKTDKFKTSMRIGADGISTFLRQKKDAKLSDRVRNVESEVQVKARLRWNKSNWNYEVLNVITGGRTIMMELELLDVLINKINKYEQTDKQKATD